MAEGRDDDLLFPADDREDGEDDASNEFLSRDVELLIVVVRVNDLEPDAAAIREAQIEDAAGIGDVPRPAGPVENDGPGERAFPPG